MVPGQIFPQIALMVLTTSNGEHGLFMFFSRFSLIFQRTWLKIPDFLASSLVLPVQQHGGMEVAPGRSAEFRFLWRSSKGVRSPLRPSLPQTPRPRVLRMLLYGAAVYPVPPKDLRISCKNTPAAQSSGKLKINLNRKVK